MQGLVLLENCKFFVDANRVNSLRPQKQESEYHTEITVSILFHSYKSILNNQLRNIAFDTFLSSCLADNYNLLSQFCQNRATISKQKSTHCFYGNIRPTSNLSGLANLVAGAMLENAFGMTPCWDTMEDGDSPLVWAPVTATVCRAGLRYGLYATADVGVAVPPMYWGCA